jgi:hypothetical protein
MVVSRRQASLVPQPAQAGIFRADQMRRPLAANRRISLDGLFTQASRPIRRSNAGLALRRGGSPGAGGCCFSSRCRRRTIFEFMGYSYMSGGVAQGHLRPGRSAEQELIAGKYDVFGLKQRTIRQTFRLNGPDRLAKVVAVDGPSGTKPYPPGSGVPQGKLVHPLPFRVWGFVGPGQVYTSDQIAGV